MPLPISKSITPLLQTWYQHHHRPLPWRNTTDPYRIWLSEVILQQTRVIQGIGYYERFIETFPTIQDLAEASEDQVLLLWQGLGYYSRARNLHKAAQIVVEQYGGAFPSLFEQIRSLPGIGAYTAGAIASFAYNQCYPAVDGNVLRVMSRLTACALPIDGSVGKKELTETVETLLRVGEPAIFNQAIIELGALICTPKNPQCSICPLSAHCALSESPEVELYPRKEKQIAVRHRYLNYIVLSTHSGAYYIRKRAMKDIWQGLYEFPLIETDSEVNAEELLRLVQENYNDTISLLSSRPVFEMLHRLSHQLLHIHVYTATGNENSPLSHLFTAVRWEELSSYAFPVPLTRFIQEQHL